MPNLPHILEVLVRSKYTSAALRRGLPLHVSLTYLSWPIPMGVQKNLLGLSRPGPPTARMSLPCALRAWAAFNFVHVCSIVAITRLPAVASATRCLFLRHAPIKTVASRWREPRWKPRRPPVRLSPASSLMVCTNSLLSVSHSVAIRRCDPAQAGARASWPNVSDGAGSGDHDRRLLPPW